jgi:hypothetical protein
MVRTALSQMSFHDCGFNSRSAVLPTRRTRTRLHPLLSHFRYGGGLHDQGYAQAYARAAQWRTMGSQSLAPPLTLIQHLIDKFFSGNRFEGG